jgi:hypothetical protein
MLKPVKRKGMTFLEVVLGVSVLTVGLLGISVLFGSVFDQLTPKTGGLRRYLLAEEILKAQAEALRTKQYLFTTTFSASILFNPLCYPASLTFDSPTFRPSTLKFILEPPGWPYRLTIGTPINQTFNTPAGAPCQYMFDDISVTPGPQTAGVLGTLSLSTLRYAVGGTDGKIGL